MIKIKFHINSKKQESKFETSQSKYFKNLKYWLIEIYL
jgi:hypothetical protein